MARQVRRGLAAQGESEWAALSYSSYYRHSPVLPASGIPQRLLLFSAYSIPGLFSLSHVLLDGPLLARLSISLAYSGCSLTLPSAI